MFGKGYQVLQYQQLKAISATTLSCVPKQKLIDNHGRELNYLRLSITDRCNLRCRYCRPETGVPFIHHDEILRFEELERLVAIFASLGISKVRVTGGEPFSRRGCLPFLQRLKNLEGIKHVHITTNGVKTGRYLNELAAFGIDGINLSLDTLDPKRFWQISRRDYLDSVLESLHSALKLGIPLKVNSVILEDTQDGEILHLSSLAQKHPITLRFIEMMPFSGTSRSKKIVNGNLVNRLHRLFPDIQEHTSDVSTTARIFFTPGFQGKLGLIQGFSRLFCKTCNKLRITPSGMLKTCLYDNGALDLKNLLRIGAGDQEISDAIVASVQNRFANGYDAESFCIRDSETSMSTIGG